MQHVLAFCRTTTTNYAPAATGQQSDDEVESDREAPVDLSSDEESATSTSNSQSSQAAKPVNKKQKTSSAAKTAKVSLHSHSSKFLNLIFGYSLLSTHDHMIYYVSRLSLFY